MIKIVFRGYNFTNIIIILAVTSLMIFLYGKIDSAKEPFSTWDLIHYRAMAESSPYLNTNVIQPFVYRILGPYLVGLLPIPVSSAFYIFSIIASFSTCILFYFFLLNMGISSKVSTLTVVLFSFNKYFFGFPIWDFFQINDLLANFLIILLFWAMLKRKWLLFGIILLLGAITRETTLLFVPVAIVYLVEKKIIKADLIRVLLAIIPALITFCSLRLLITASGDGPFQAFINCAGKLFSIEGWLRLLINPFIPLTLIPLIFYEKTIHFFIDKKFAVVYLFLVFLSALCGLSNERLMSPTFIVFYWLLASTMEIEEFRTNLACIFYIIACTFLSSFHHQISRFSFMDKKMVIIVSIFSLASVTIFSVLNKKKYYNQN